MDNKVQIQPLVESQIYRDYQMIQKNEKYLESYGEGYPTIHSANEYFHYLLSIYGDFENIALKRFTIMYGNIPVGQIGLHSFCVHNFCSEAEIFYWVDEQYQGKGIVTQACNLLQKHAFEILGLDLLIIHCLVDNIKSANVAQRCGFDYEGISKLESDYKKFVKTYDQFQQEEIIRKY